MTQSASKTVCLFLKYGNKKKPVCVLDLLQTSLLLSLRRLFCLRLYMGSSWSSPWEMPGCCPEASAFLLTRGPQAEQQSRHRKAGVLYPTTRWGAFLCAPSPTPGIPSCHLITGFHPST